MVNQEILVDDDVSITSCFSKYCLETYEHMQNSTIFTDATMTFSNGTKLYVHRIILCAASEYFRNIFAPSMSAGHSEIQMCHTDSNTMKLIINYIYSRKISIDEHNILDLIKASELAQIPNLVQLCSNFIMEKHLKIENCLFLMLYVRSITSDLYENIRSYVLQHFPLVAETTYLLALSVDDLYDIISDDQLNVNDEELVWRCCLRWISHNISERMNYSWRLLKAVRIGFLDGEYIMEQVENHPYLLAENISADDTLNASQGVGDLWNAYGIGTPTPVVPVPRIPHEILFGIGGQIGTYNNILIETYDLRSDRWQDLPQEISLLQRPKCYHGTVVIGTKLYCIGGFDGRDYLSTCHVFNTVTQTWSEIAAMHFQRCHVSVAELNGHIYAMGGYDGIIRQRSVERYDPATNQWTIIQSMNFKRSDGGACILNGQIYVIGGYSGTSSRNTGERYDPRTGRWNLIEPMAIRRSGHAVASYNGHIYVVGGFDGFERIGTVEKYDPVTKSWTFLEDMINARSNFGMAIANDMMFVAGGFDGIAILTQTEYYNFETDSWREANSLKRPRLALTVTTVSGLPNVRDYAFPYREYLFSKQNEKTLWEELNSAL